MLYRFAVCINPLQYATTPYPMPIIALKYIQTYYDTSRSRKSTSLRSSRPAYEAVELMEPLLSSDDREVMSVSRVDDRRRWTFSNCCLVCWCMSLGDKSATRYMAALAISMTLTFDMSSSPSLVATDQTVARNLLGPPWARGQTPCGCRRPVLLQKTW